MSRSPADTSVPCSRRRARSNYPLATLARRLGGSPFLRISRDAIVNMTVVTEITRVGDRRYELRLLDRARTVAEASRTGAALLADYLRSGRPG